MNKNFALGMYAATFFAGAFFILGNSADITANVIGASGTGALVSEVVGLVLIVASAALFMMTLSLERAVEKEKVSYNHAHHSDYDDMKNSPKLHDEKAAAEKEDKKE